MSFLNQPDSHSSLRAQGFALSELPWLVTQPLAAQQEAMLLQWAEEEIFAQLHKERTQKPQQAIHIRWPGWLLLGTTLMASIAFLVLMLPTASRPPPMHIKDVMVAHSHWPPRPHHPVMLHGHPQQSGTLHHPGHWHAETGAKARLTLYRNHTKHVKLHLHQGHLHLKVKSGTMRHVAIHTKQFRIVVHGASVSVMRGIKHCHVEVTGGFVAVHGPGWTQTLKAGKGMKLALATPHRSKKPYQWTKSSNNLLIPQRLHKLPNDLL